MFIWFFSLYRTYCTAQRTQCYQGKCEKHNNTNNCSSETEKKSPKESRTPKQKQQLYQHRPQIAGKVSAISALGRWPRYRGLSPQRGDCERQNKTTWRKQTKTQKKTRKQRNKLKHMIYSRLFEKAGGLHENPLRIVFVLFCLFLCVFVLFRFVMFIFCFVCCFLDVLFFVFAIVLKYIFCFLEVEVVLFYVTGW